MKLQMKTATERKRKEPFNKHKAKNTKTNSLQTKSSREQFHLIGCAAALAYKVTQSDRTAAVGVSLIKQLFSFPEKLQSSELVLHLKAWTKPGQNKGRASAQTSLRRWSEGWKEFQTESKPKAPCWLLRQKERNSPKNWRSLICSIILWQLLILLRHQPCSQTENSSLLIHQHWTCT